MVAAASRRQGHHAASYSVRHDFFLKKRCGPNRVKISSCQPARGVQALQLVFHLGPVCMRASCVVVCSLFVSACPLFVAVCSLFVDASSCAGSCVDCAGLSVHILLRGSAQHIHAYQKPPPGAPGPATPCHCGGVLRGMTLHTRFSGEC